jgi:catechol 2,3-dioxygenase-like lactoylglutathione lyase family enzyme
MSQNDIRKIQVQGVHHITLNGADRQTSIDFWEGVLGMPFIFDQPNLDDPNQGHLYFDPGDGRLITIFTNEERAPDPQTYRRPWARSITSPSTSARRASGRSPSGWMRAACPIPGPWTAASWTRSISAIRLGSGSNWPATASSRPKAAARPT